MHVGVCRVRLRLPDSHSLKEKRGVLKSVVARVANKFSVCAAEVDDMDVWQIATIGITTVSNNSRHNNEVLSKAVDFIIACTSDAEVLDYEIELLCVL